MWHALVFDVNDTLLDLSALDPLFAELFGDPAARQDWFTRVLISAMTVAASGGYRGFDEIGSAALGVTAQRYGREIGTGERLRVGRAMRRLPPYPEVPAALDRLRAAGYPLVALSNSPAAVMEEQLAVAGIAERFQERLSVEPARTLKPAPGVYRLAANHLGVAPRSLLMVAAHGWDLAGAGAVGLDTAFVARSGQFPDPLFPAPRVTGADLDAVATAILDEARHSSPPR